MSLSPPYLSNHHAIFQFRKTTSHMIYFSTSYSNTSRIHRGIRSSFNNQRVSWSHSSKVSMPPDTRILVKICLCISFKVFITPKIEWHRRYRSTTHQFAFFSNHTLSLVIQYLSIHIFSMRIHKKIFVLSTYSNIHS